MKQKSGRFTYKIKNSILCTVCRKEFQQILTKPSSTSICKHCRNLNFVQSSYLFAEREANHQALIESLLKNLQNRDIIELDIILKKILKTAFTLYSPYCDKFFIEAGIIERILYTLREEANDTDNIIKRMSKEEKRIGKYQIDSFNKIKIEGEEIFEAIPYFSCTKITSNAVGEDKFCVIVLFHHGEMIWSLSNKLSSTYQPGSINVTQEKHAELLEKLMSLYNTDLGVLITTGEYGLPLTPRKSSINLIDGKQLATMMIDLEVGVKPIYKLYQIDDSLFDRY